MPIFSDLSEAELSEISTPKQVSDFTGIPESSLAQDRYLKTGIPYVKFGKRVRYLRTDVLAYIEANRVSTSA